MNREERLKVLAESLAAANRRAQDEQDQAKQVDRITAAVKAKLAHRIHASDEFDLRCPQCGFTASEDQFDEVEEPDDDESHGYRTDDVTSVGDGNEDEDNEGDRELDAAGKSRVVAELLKNRRIR